MFHRTWASVNPVMDQYSPPELAELALLAGASMDTQFQYWISVTFAVVVASFVAGERLSRPMRLLAATLYLLASILLISRFLQFAQTTRIYEIALEDASSPSIAAGRLIVFTRFVLFALGTASALYFLLKAKKPRDGSST